MEQRAKLLGKGILPYKVAEEIGVSPSQVLGPEHIARKVSQNSLGQYLEAMDRPKQRIENNGSRLIQTTRAQKPTKRRSFSGLLKFARKVFLPGLAPKKNLLGHRNLDGDLRMYAGAILGGMFLALASVPMLSPIGVGVCVWGLVNSFLAQTVSLGVPDA